MSEFQPPNVWEQFTQLYQVPMVWTGTDGDDKKSCGIKADDLWDGAGNDQLSDFAGNNRTLGAAGNDWLYGQDEDDSLDGGDGHNFLCGHLGDGNQYRKSGNGTLTCRVGADAFV